MENNEDSEDLIDVVTTDTSVLDALNGSASDPKVYIGINEVSSNFLPPTIKYDTIGEFCFESDELALKGNTDYKNLLEAIVVLEAQRAKAVQDLDQLQKLKEKALADPFEFLERMRKKENLHFPVRQKIHPVPAIDWGKYAVSGNASAFERRQISQQRQQTQEYFRNGNKKAKLHLGTNEQKSAKNNQLWTVAELIQLKELLQEFPPENEEAFRWRKIATALGSHTPLEVAAKICEEYLLLHAEIGDALGKMPDLNALKKKWSESNTEEGHIQNSSAQKENASQIEISDDDEISPEFQDSPEYQELLLLKKTLREKVVEESSGTAQHVGYQCCRCKTEPIVGTRWHCVDCKPPLSTDFCEDCAGSSYESRQHTSDHRLEKQKLNKGFMDRDYMHFLGSDYNYLDPNYMPAT